MTNSVQGEFFQPSSGQSVPCFLQLDIEQQTFLFSMEGAEYSGLISDLNIEPPLGSQPRKIYLPEGHLFQTDEREALAELLPKTGWSFVSMVEKFGPHLIPIAIATPFVAYGVYRMVMPLFISMALGLTPTSVVHQMDKSTISTLDRFITDDSDLPAETQTKLTEIFTELVESGAGERTQRPPKYRLLFRGGKMGPNAFALPGGTIVITDDLVEMFPDNEDVLAGVLGHEIGHVEKEHSLRRLYRAVGIATMVTLMAGDSGPMVEEILLEGGALLSLSFSRDQEMESDNFAVDLMHEIGRNPEAMALFFEEIENFNPFKADDDEKARENHKHETDEDKNGGDKDRSEAKNNSPVGDVISPKSPTSNKSAPKINTEWISTHPLSQKRIDNIRARAAKLRGE